MIKIPFEIVEGEDNVEIIETLKTEISFLNKGFWQIEIKKPKRTTVQNASLHLFCEWTAKGLNHQGLYQRRYSVLDQSVVIESKWTMEKVKEDIWKPLMLKETGKTSTTQMTTSECAKIGEELIAALNESFGHLGFHARWPNKEDLQRAKFYNLKE